MNSITQLKSLLDNQANAKAISACCARILHLEEDKVHDNNAAEEDEDDATVIPAEIKNIVTTTYLRSLLNLGKYSQVVDYCRKQTREQQQQQPPQPPQQEQSFATEQAYALYRLRNYHACRDLCERHGCHANASAATTTTASGEAASSMGLLHIYAQTLYRLGETKSTDLIYRQLLLRGSSTAATDDVDEREDALSNALANGTANYTPGCCGGAGAGGGGNASSIYSWLEEQEEVCQLLKDYGNDNANNNNNDNGNDNDGGEEKEELLQNYDLAYNLATFLLVSSESRSRSKVVQAKTLLGHAEASALTILESSSDDNNDVNGDDNDNGDEGEKEKAAKEKKQKQQQQQQQQKQQQQLQLAEQEAGPIRANLALANLLLGGEENEMAALRTYLTLVTKAAAAAKGGNSNNSSSSSGGNNKGNANLIATASNNLACIRDGKESVFDVLKRIPTTSSLSVSEDNIGGGAAATMVVPLVGATPQQVRTALFNRALQFAKMGNSGGCQEALAVLRASLLVSSHGDGDAARSNNVSGGGGGGGETKNANVGGGSSKKNSKGKKKKGAGATASGSAGGGGSGDGSTTASVSGEDVPTAKPSTEIEAIAWRARADWIESELLRLTSSSFSDSANKKTSDELINGAIANLDKAIKVYKDDDASGILPYTKSQLLLHRAVVANPQSKTQPLIAALESLPSEVQSCPGTIVTLASLYGSSNSSEESTSRAEELLSSLGNEGSARLALAEFRLEKGQYEEAAELLQQIVDNADSTDSVEAMTATALLVRALSYVDPEKAAELAEDLQEEMMMQEGDEELDGEALESMEIPRFAKKAMGARGGGEGGSSSKVRKLIEATGGKRGSNLGERKKKNREVILRKRAKQREAYLSHLQSEGRYNPDQTPLAKPDPERWIPKSQRSYNRRGRRGRFKSNIGAQGGGAGAGMEKEAAKLDVAARVAAAKAGIVEGSGKPSTANVKVSESGAVRKGKGGRRR